MTIRLGVARVGHPMLSQGHTSFSTYITSTIIMDEQQRSTVFQLLFEEDIEDEPCDYPSVQCVETTATNKVGF